MGKRIGEVISKIYLGESGEAGRQVLTLSRADAESLPLISGVAMISITAPEQSDASLPIYEYLLRLTFSDVDFLSKDLSPRAVAKIPCSFTRAQAQDILNFVDALPESIHTLIVHCAGGYSRSAGIASALGDIYGFTTEPHKLAEANQSVRALLLQVADQEKQLNQKSKGKGLRG